MQAYSVIYADCPWRYQDKRIGRGGCERYYPTMTPQQLRAMPVHDLAAGDCALFLWVTPPMLAVGLGVMQAWGFEFKTKAFTWVKRGASGKLAWGTGAWTRANTEDCLLGVRGHPRRASAAVHQVVEAPRGEHSEKPGIVRERIVELMGDVPRIELFARQAVSGWDRWGLDAPDGEGLVQL